MALLPVAITVAIVAWIANVVSDLVGPGSTIGLMLKRSGWNFGSTEAGAYLGGALFAIVLIYVLGIFIQTILKDRWSGILSDISSKVPVVGTIYDASSKVVQMLTPGESEDLRSMTPVMCTFGGEGGTAFPAFLPTPEIFCIQGEEYHVVMIPTAPVPFGGAILCVPRERVTKLDCGIDGLFNIYMSMGTKVPDYLNPKAPQVPDSDARS
jgi:uncharacterized membrane protein